MTPVLVGLLLGVGLFCVWWSFWPVEESRQSGRRPGVRDRLQDEITQIQKDIISGKIKITSPSQPQ